MKRASLSVILVLVASLGRAASPAPNASGGPPPRSELLERFDFDEYARQPVSFYYCQAGFPPAAYKPVYVWTRDAFSQGSAVLRNTATGQSVSVPLTSCGTNIWGRQDWVADCSRVTAEGDYTLRADFGGHSAETAPFTISGNCYDDLREKAAKHFFLKRCGIFCHVHDANLYALDPGHVGNVLRHVPAAGGWHDAHDDNKLLPLVWAAVYGLLKTQERCSPQWCGSNEPYPYCLAEAWWEVQWLLRMQKADGSFYYAVLEWAPSQKDGRTILNVHQGGSQNYDDLHHDRRAVVDVWGENAICDLAGRRHNTCPSTAPKYFAYCGHVLRYCGRLLRPFDRPNAERCVQAARRTADYLQRLPEYPPYQELEVHAGLALYYLEDARDGGGAAALAKAEGHLQRMLALQQPEGHFHASAKCRGLEFHPQDAGDERVFVDYPFGYLAAFIEYLEYARQGPGKACALTAEIQGSLLRFARMLDRFCHATVFGQPGEIRFDGQPAVIIPPRIACHGYNPYILSTGVLFAAAQRLAGYRGGQQRAERQLQWVFGANPRFMSFMNQVGVRNAGQYAASSSVSARYYPMAFYRHLRDMRWGVTTGIFGPLEKRSSDGQSRTIEYLQPENYPNAGDSMHGKYVSTAQETWLNCNGWLLLLLAQLGTGGGS